MKRILTLILALILTVGFLPLTSHGELTGGSKLDPKKFPTVPRDTRKVYTMMQPEDLSEDDFDDRGALGFWRQLSIHREDVETVTFLDSTQDAPKWAWDVSEKLDKTVLCWYQQGSVYVAADGKIALNETSSYLFAGMNHLKQIDFGDVVDTSQVKSMDHMFQGCKKLEALDLTHFDTSGAEDMSAMFYDCHTLEELDVSMFDTSNVTNMKSMFAACYNLEALDLSTFDTSNVTNMYAMFDSCMKLEKIDLSSFDTAKVKDMSNFLAGCKALTEADLHSFDTKRCQYFNNFFRSCTALKRLDLSGFSTKNIIGMNFMFTGVPALEDFRCTDSRIKEAYRQR